MRYEDSSRIMKFIPLLFAFTLLLMSGVVLYLSIRWTFNIAGVLLSLGLFCTAIAITIITLSKAADSGMEKIEARILPKSPHLKFGLFLAVIFWAFAWSTWMSPFDKAPDGRGAFILGPIYNIAGNEGIVFLAAIIGLIGLMFGIIKR